MQHNVARTKEDTMAHHPGATYLLSDGRIVPGEYPVCYQTHVVYPQTPLLPDIDNDGLWAEIPDVDPNDLSATRTIAWLSPEGEALLRGSGQLHAFRNAVRHSNQDAQVVHYHRANGAVAREMVMILEGE
jgi:hypothetical protein